MKSDVAPLNGLVRALLEFGVDVHVLRDPTRGGLATSLNEIAMQSKVGILLTEESIPVRPAVAAACEVLGFDPLYVANEGKLIVLVASQDAEKAQAVMRNTRDGECTVQVGRAIADHPGRVMMKTRLGSTRIVDRLSGEMLPRIC